MSRPLKINTTITFWHCATYHCSTLIQKKSTHTLMKVSGWQVFKQKDPTYYFIDKSETFYKYVSMWPI